MTQVNTVEPEALIWNLSCQEQDNSHSYKLAATQLITEQGILIGSDAEADIRLNYSGIASKHCRLWIDADNILYVVDLGSEHGTIINNAVLIVGKIQALTADTSLILAGVKLDIEFPKVLPPKFKQATQKHNKIISSKVKLIQRAKVTSSNKSVQLHSVAVECLMTFSARKPWLSLLIIMFFSFLSVLELPQLKLDTSIDSMLNKNNPDMQIYQEVMQNFGSDNITLIHFAHPNLFSVQKLQQLEHVVHELESLEMVEKVESLFNSLSIRDSEWGLEINPLISELPTTAAEADRIRQNAIYSPLLKGNQLSNDATKTTLMVTLRTDLHNSAASKDIYQIIERIITPTRGEFQQVFQIGNPRIDVEFSTGIASDMITLAPYGIGVLVFSLVLMLRTWMVVWLPLVTAGISILWAAGILAYFNIPINLLIGILPTLVIVIGSTEDTHMLAAYLQGLKQNPQQRFPSIRFMAIHVGLPIFITSFTTIVGFLSNTTSDISLIHDFGIASAIAMFTNLCATILLLPLLLNLVGPKNSKISFNLHADTGLIAAVVRGIEKIINKYQILVITITSIIVVLFGFFSTQLSASNDPLSFFKSGNALITDSEILHDNIAGMQLFFVTVHASHKTDFKNPIELNKLDLIKQIMQQQGAYDHITVVTDYLKLVNREMHQAQPQFYKLPDSRNLIEQYLMLFQRHDLERVLSGDAKTANFLVRHNISDSAALNKHLTELKQQVNELLGDKNKFYLTGKNLMINQAAETLFISQQHSLVILILIIGILMALLYSSITAGLVALIPNIIPVIIMFGTMGLLGIPLNAGTALVSVIAIGIAIDDTIHILSTYNRECRLDGDQHAATTRAIRAEALPVIATSLSLAAGFCTLVLSDFHVITQFGLLSALTMIVAMLTDLILTPILFKRIRLVSLWDVVALNIGEQVLTQSIIFASMSRFEIKRVILLSQVLEYQAGETVIQQGETGDKLFIILQGQTEILIQKPDCEKRIASLSWGEVFGEAGYAGDVTRTATVRVPLNTEPLRVIVLNQAQTQTAMRFYPRLHAKLNHNISKLLAQRLLERTKMVML